MKLMTISLVLAGLCAPVALFAEEGPDMNITVDYVNKYIFRGMDLLADDKPAVQPSLTLTSNGLLLSIWTSMGLSDRETYKEADEIDLIGEYSAAFTDWMTYTFGAIAFINPNIPVTFSELYAGIALEAPLNPSLMYYYEYTHGNNGFLEFGVAHTHSLMRSVSVTATANMGYDNGLMVEDPAISHVDIALIPSFSAQNYELYGQFHYVIVPDKDVGINDEDEFWFGIGLSANFTLVR
ncbi:MAG: hypothetical protein D6675_14685 [Gemmatimonadetes bacterium]|nr:MAG: hypothetical protein D6675_14685 [Gemmatimonadota bacterium]